MYIYVITNNINGKEYIGKTTKLNIKDRWKRHLADSKYHKSKLYNSINKYGSNNFTIDVMECTGNVTRERLNDRERYWIEVIEPEYNMTKGGDGGWINDQTGKHWKIKDTSNMRGKKTITDKVIDGRKKLSGGNNYQSKYHIHTPWGIYDTWLEAVQHAQHLKSSGEINVICNSRTLQVYCKQNIKLNIEGRRTPKFWRGKFTKDIGFFIEVKDE